MIQIPFICIRRQIKQGVLSFTLRMYEYVDLILDIIHHAQEMQSQK